MRKINGTLIPGYKLYRGDGIVGGGGGVAIYVKECIKSAGERSELIIF